MFFNEKADRESRSARADYLTAGSKYFSTSSSARKGNTEKQFVHIRPFRTTMLFFFENILNSCPVLVAFVTPRRTSISFSPQSGHL